MASGHPGHGRGGGGEELYDGTGIPERSTIQTGSNPSPNSFPLQRHQLPRMFLDQATPPLPPPPSLLLRKQIPQRFTQPTASLIGKRTLAEFQAAHNHQQQSSNPLHQQLLRSVKPRLTMATPAPSPISTLSPPELSPKPAMIATNPAGPHVVGHKDPSFSLEKKKLQELEKRLLLDDDNDAASAISSLDNSSEWSEHINLIAPNPIAPSPTTSSSSSSSSVTNPVPPPCTRQTLLEVASAISESRYDGALEILSRCPAQPSSNASQEEKLIGFLAGALKSRVNPADYPPPVSELYSKEHSESTRSLYELSPCFKLGFMAANLAIIDAAIGRDAVHVIDFDVGNCGGQYVNLLQALYSARGNAPTLLKLTAVHDWDNDRLAEVSEVLGRVANRVGVQFRFNSVDLRKLGGLTKLTRASLDVDEDEAVAVNLAFKLYRVPDESVSVENPRDELLRRARGLSPLVMTLVEQEINVNTAPFYPRVRETCEYYGALLDSIEATVMRGSGVRDKAETGIGRRVGNAVACEGRERVERCEVFGKWRARLGMAGFKQMPMGQEVAMSLRKRVNPGAGRVNPGFTVKEEAGGVLIGWMEKTLTVASAWR